MVDPDRDREVDAGAEAEVGPAAEVDVLVRVGRVDQRNGIPDLAGTEPRSPRYRPVVVTSRGIGRVSLELEGAPDWIDATGKKLGFSAPDYILLSYGRLYLEAVAADPGLPPHMVFSGENGGA